MCEQQLWGTRERVWPGKCQQHPGWDLGPRAVLAVVSIKLSMLARVWV